MFSLKSGTEHLAQARGEAGKLSVHAVLIHGWCSATAGGHCSQKRICGKNECGGKFREDHSKMISVEMIGTCAVVCPGRINLQKSGGNGRDGLNSKTGGGKMKAQAAFT
jgi:hypothetical protein